MTILATMLGLCSYSLLVGYPVARYFPVSRSSMTFLALCINFGFAFSLLISLTVIEFTSLNLIDLRVLFLLLPVLSLLLFILDQVRNKHQRILLGNLFLVILSAPLMVLIPLKVLISNNWYFAEGAGDDGARWFMMENYLLNHSFSLWNPVETTLRFSFDGRIASLVSNAFVKTLFSPHDGTSTTVSYLFAVVCAGILSISLVVEKMPELQVATRVRSFIYLFLAITFGCIGTTINLFFSGRLTQIFSLFPYFALIFTSLVLSEFRWKFLNYSFWTIFLSFAYSARYILLCCITIIALESFILIKSKAITKLASLKIILLSTGPSFLALVLSSQEVLGIGNLLLADRGRDYGLFNSPLLQNILVWFGLISTWTPLGSIPPTQLFVMTSSLIAFIALLLIFIFGRKKLNTDDFFQGVLGVLVMLVSVLISVSLLGSFFVVYKLSTYLPFVLFIVISAASLKFMLLTNQSFIYRAAVPMLTAITFFSWHFSSTQQDVLFSNLISERESYISEDTIEIASIVNASSSASNFVYAHIPAPESHLLTRALFFQSSWVPIQSIDYDFNSEIVDMPAIDSIHNWLLVRDRIECQVIDFSSNGEPLFHAHNMYLFSERSSVIEFQSGMVLRQSMANEVSECPQSRFQFREISDKGMFVFRNGSKSDFLRVTFQMASGEKCNKIEISGNIYPKKKWIAEEIPASNLCDIEIRGGGLKNNYLNRFVILNRMKSEILVRSISWRE
jgi:hypothetical protein